MKLGDDVMKILGRSYEANTLVERRMGRYELAFKTDELGRPVLLFLGKADENGRIKGERFARRLVTDAAGNIIKDFWDNKGKIR